MPDAQSQPDLIPLPALPAHVISVTIILCERVLNEKDGVLSVVRIVDTYEIAKEGLPPEGERGPIMMHILIMVKLVPSQGETNHSIQLRIIRPNGEIADIGAPTSAVTPPGQSDASVGLNVIVPLGVIPKRMGLHYVECLLDGQAAARMPFTLRLVEQTPRAE